MNPEQAVLKALHALGESDRDRQASPEAEARLKLAFRHRRTVRKWRRMSALAIAAGVVVALFAIYARGPRRIERVPVRQPTETASAIPVPGASRAAASAPVIKARTRHRAQPEIVTDFFPLMDVPPPIGRGALVRVNLPAEAMRSVGLPVREDGLSERVQADVLLSEEGMATAIRFVKVF